jgi:ribosomal protein S18 acetylase RimI-like enzyme
MKVKIRRTTNDDLDSIYELHTKCFSQNDYWYKSAIKNYIDTGIVVENNSKIIGVLLQGSITPCNKDSELFGKNIDIFEPVNIYGKDFYNNKQQFMEIQGIMMICIDPKYRGKGLAKKLIEIHFKDNIDKLVCLNTRRTNINAYSLYKTMGYQHIGFIKNKYFLPDEDSIFMIKQL